MDINALMNMMGGTSTSSAPSSNLLNAIQSQANQGMTRPMPGRDFLPPGMNPQNFIQKLPGRTMPQMSPQEAIRLLLGR